MKDYIIFFAQAFPNFRLAELESIADYYDIPIVVGEHKELNPFLVVQLESDDHAKKIMERCILGKGIYELWGHGKTLEELHVDVQAQSSDKFALYKTCSFKFNFVTYMGSRTGKEKAQTIESFSYLAFTGPVRLKNADVTFSVLEEYFVCGNDKATTPINLWFGREIQLSARSMGVLDQYDLKRRKYIGTTSFDAELSLITCNIGQVGKGKIFYDPFTGTGSFLVAGAYFGGLAIGSDIDVRMIKGKNDKCTIRQNFKQYGTLTNFLDTMTMDFTNNAIRPSFPIDCIICDPPYGVREGLKVCGTKDAETAAKREKVVIDGEKAYLRKDYIPAKKAYELSNLLEDLLNFAAERLPVGGRLAFWMPTANDDFEVHNLPQHEQLELLYNLEQEFNKWSRRLLVYVKRDENYRGKTINGLKVNNIKNFRERYFNGFNAKSR